MTRLKPMLRPRIITIDKLRVVFRNAFRMPSVIVFMSGTILPPPENNLKEI